MRLIKIIIIMYVIIYEYTINLSIIITSKTIIVVNFTVIKNKLKNECKVSTVLMYTMCWVGHY